MKFKNFIGLVLLCGCYFALEDANRLVIDSGGSSNANTPSAFALPFARNRGLLERYMSLGEIKSEFEGLNFDQLPFEQKAVLVANDYRLKTRPKVARKLDGELTTGQDLTHTLPNLDVPSTLSTQNIYIVEEQKRLILLQFYEVIREAQGGEAVASDEIINLLTSYLQHLDYIYSKTAQHSERSPPALYNYKIKETIKPYCDSAPLTLPNEDFLNEESDVMVYYFDQYNQQKLNIGRKAVQLPRLIQNAKQLEKRDSRFLNTYRPNSYDPYREKQFIETKIFVAGPYDVPIEDHLQEYQRGYTVDMPNLTNLFQSVMTLRDEYRKIFQRISDLNNEILAANSGENSSLTVEDYDMVKQIAKSIICTTNPHKKIMNQIITSFTERNPNLAFFQRLYKQSDIVPHISHVRHHSGFGDINQDYNIKMLIEQLRRAYFTCIIKAKESETIFDNFGYQSELLRTTPPSSTFNVYQMRTALSNLRTWLPRLSSFSETFDSNLTELSDNLRTLDTSDVTLYNMTFRSKYEIEHMLDEEQEKEKQRQIQIEKDMEAELERLKKLNEKSTIKLSV